MYGVLFFRPSMKQTFKKEERLTHKKTISGLFESGQSFAAYPYRILWLKTDPSISFPVQLAISVPKRSFAKAADRNILKRRIREAYRKNKSLLYEVLRKKNLSLAVIAIYTGKEVLLYDEIERKMVVSLRKLGELAI